MYQKNTVSVRPRDVIKIMGILELIGVKFKQNKILAF